MKFAAKLVLFAACLVGQIVSAETKTNSFVKLNDKAIYNRCHMQLVRRRPSSNDENLINLESKKMTGPQACMNLLAEAGMKENGQLFQQNERSLNILRTVQSLHSSWFPQKEFIRDDFDAVGYNIFDANEMGYHFTYNLLGKSEKASKIVTRKDSFRGLRVSEKKAQFLNQAGTADMYLNINVDWLLGDVDRKDVLKIKPKQVQFGNLVGLELMKVNENSYPYKQRKGEPLKFDLTNSLGAGVVGTRSYILLNTSLSQDSKSDGGLLSHRSWSKAVFHDLLCRNLPVVRQDDVGHEVYPNSKISFRKDKSCMRCHVSMDPMANSIRNVYEVRSSPKYGIFVASPRILAEVSPSHKPNKKMVDSDIDFYKRPTDGKLFFRTYDGKLINQSVSNVQDLGNALAKTDDFYICTAKKYFEFFTGVSVPIDDFASERYQTSDVELIGYREFVIKLGLDLKKSQSLQKMIGKIFESSIYQDLNYRVVDE